MKLMNNKKGVSDPSDPIFWAIVGGLSLLCILVTWKGPFADWAPMKLKILLTIVVGPMIYGICYVMGQNG